MLKKNLANPLDMEEYKVTYEVEKKGRKYTITTSCDRTLPLFLWGSHNLSRAEEIIPLEKVLFERAKEIKKPLRLEMIFRVSE